MSDNQAVDAYIEFDQLAHAYGGARAAGVIKATPEVFQVEEVLGYEPDGTGDHAWLRIRKRNTNTDWLARRLGELARVRPVAVGYAGLKDRNALTTQWFSVNLAEVAEPDWRRLESEDVSVLVVTRSRRKLRRGALRGNRFLIAVEGLEGDAHDMARRLDRVAAGGVPNYFGPQRFGRDGGNVRPALELLLGKRRVRDRHRRGLYLSTARSLLFNRVLDERVRAGTWNSWVPGDLMMLDGTHSVFSALEGDDRLVARLERLDVHPTGPLWGAGPAPSTGDARRLEESACPSAWRDGVASAGLEHARRALRLPAREMRWQWCGNNRMELAFTLDAGGYATAVLRELVAARLHPSDPGAGY